MRTVAILSEKGGAGKTTLAIHLATAAQLHGHATALVDLDPQGSAADWADSRSKPPEALAIPPVRLSVILKRLKDGGCSLVVIDTGRDSNNAGYTAAVHADLLLVPCRIGRFDLRAIGRTLDLAKLAGKTVYVLLNDTAPRAGKMIAAAREALQPLACEIAPVGLSHRATFRDAPITGRTAQEVEPNGLAAAEVDAVWRWISEQLTLPYHYTSQP